MNSENIVTRFPPSPTGYLHIGGARTALFNWLFARQRGGKFILRIEDTDKARSSEAASRAIIESMEWLGLDWDDGPYFQSERQEIYNSFIDKLISNGQAYYCHCSPEQLEQSRKEARAKGLKPKYAGTCRDRELGPHKGSVVRLKIPQTGRTGFIDLVKGPIYVNNEEMDDLILRRSDGSPTYHMAVVADDINLGITYVIRGDDHVNNTPRQMLIYNALGEPLPQYAHVPMILGSDRTRLSKRHGALSVLAYRDMGYLAPALLNALARLGWSHGDQEKFTKDELIDYFSLNNVGKSAGVFNAEKLLDLNAWYIRNSSTALLSREIKPYLENMGCDSIQVEKLPSAVDTLKKRSKTLVEMAEGACFYFQDAVSYDQKAAEKYLDDEVAVFFKDLNVKLKELSDFRQSSLEQVFIAFLEGKKIKLKKLAQPLRVALTGRTASPGLFEMMVVLGKEKVIERINNAIRYITKKE